MSIHSYDLSIANKSPVLYGTCGFDPHPGHSLATYSLQDSYTTHPADGH